MADSAVTYIDFTRIYQIHRGIKRRISIKTGCRIDAERRPDNQKEIRFRYDVNRLFNLRHRLSEPYYMRAQLMSVRGLVSQMYFPVTDVEDGLFGETVLLIAAVFRPYLGEFAMEMQDIGTACAFMEIVHILRNDIDIELILERSDGAMCVIGSYSFELVPPYIVEVEFWYQPSMDATCCGS